jgi:YidC/Oxa1 family membrane protein insertase
MGDLFFQFLTQPMLNALMFLYHIIPDLGVGIILLTLVIKVVLFPLNWKSIKYQKQMKDVQVKVAEIKARVENKEQQAIEIMNLYKQEKINPFSSCLPLVLQLLVLIALIQVLNNVMNPSFDLKAALYPFIEYTKFNNIAFGFLDLTIKAWDKTINWIGVILAVFFNTSKQK